MLRAGSSTRINGARPRTSKVHVNRSTTAVLVATLSLVVGCPDLGAHSVYRRCRLPSDCRQSESCIELASIRPDGGSAVSGVCSSSCTLQTPESAYASAAGSTYGYVCFAVNAFGNVDTSATVGPGWELRTCGVNHVGIGNISGQLSCLPFDVGGFAIDIVIPQP